MNQVNSQNIDLHQWNNRVLLVFTNDIDNTTFKTQINELKNHEVGLKERKLVVYQITKGRYKIGLMKSTNWQNSTYLYDRYKETEAAFEILLIGLDGGNKLRKTDFISNEALFRVIDVMPMRQSELEDD